MGIINKIRGIREIWQFDNRWELIGDRLFRPKKNESIYRIKDLEILVDHAAGDANGAREILTSNMYRQFLPLLDLDNPINVLDIGANNGGFPLLLKLEEVEIGRLVSVEFNPATFKRLKINIESNFDADFELVNAAVCGENRSIPVSAEMSGTADSIYSDGQAESDDTVEGLTFDELFARTFGEEAVDVCKIDIEGAEFEVFANPGCDSIKRCRNLIIEIHHSPETPRQIIIDKLEQLGFEELNGDNKRQEGLHFVHFFKNTGP